MMPHVGLMPVNILSISFLTLACVQMTKQPNTDITVDSYFAVNTYGTHQ